MSDEIRIERGRPTDEELAAIVGVLFASRTAGAVAAPAPVSRWSRSARPGYAETDGRLTRPAHDAWRASTLPR
jgi:hypothetical protein